MFYSLWVGNSAEIHCKLYSNTHGAWSIGKRHEKLLHQNNDNTSKILSRTTTIGHDLDYTFKKYTISCMLYTLDSNYRRGGKTKFGFMCAGSGWSAASNVSTPWMISELFSFRNSLQKKNNTKNRQTNKQTKTPLSCILLVVSLTTKCWNTIRGLARLQGPCQNIHGCVKTRGSSKLHSCQK